MLDNGDDSNGHILILNRLDGGTEDEYEQWGTMDPQGRIRKDE